MTSTTQPSGRGTMVGQVDDLDLRRTFFGVAVILAVNLLLALVFSLTGFDPSPKPPLHFPVPTTEIQGGP